MSKWLEVNQLLGGSPDDPDEDVKITFLADSVRAFREYGTGTEIELENAGTLHQLRILEPYAEFKKMVTE